MREIKFEYIFKEKYGMNLHHRMFTIEDLENYEMDLFLLENSFEIVARRQSTNLKDKNGKEIYERDVICWVDEVAVEEIEGHIRYEPEGKFVEVKIPDFYFFTDDTVSSEECEIIGNVYESPELIKTT